MLSVPVFSVYEGWGKLNSVQKNVQKCIHEEKMLYSEELEQLDLFILSRWKVGIVKITACQHKAHLQNNSQSSRERQEKGKGLETKRRLESWQDGVIF